MSERKWLRDTYLVTFKKKKECKNHKKRVSLNVETDSFLYSN